MKTVLCVDESEGQPLVCKIYFKKDTKEMQEYEKNLYYKHLNTMKDIRDLYSLSLCPNVSPIIQLKDLPVIFLNNRESWDDNKRILLLQSQR
jgi:hypothetical protein